MIEYSIKKYYIEMVDCIPYGIDFCSDKILPYLFKTTLLQATGMLEKKLELFRFKFAIYDHEYRYDNLIKGNVYLSATLSSIREFIIAYTNYQNQNCNSDDFIYRLVECIKSQPSCLIYVKELVDETFNDINEVFFQDKRIQQVCGQELFFYNSCFKDLFNKTNVLEKIYKHAYDRRHNIAHNIESLYVSNSFDLLRRYDFVYDNIFAQYNMLLYIDKIFCKLYDNYLKTLNSI